MPPTDPRHTWSFLPALALLTLAACSQPEHEVDVQICGDVAVPYQIDSIRVSLLDADRQTRDEGVVELLACPSGTVKELPVALTFSPIAGQAYLRVQGLKNGREVVTIENQIELTRESDVAVRLPLTRACVGVSSCPLGQTCVQGACEVTPPADRDLRCQSDETPDTMPDTGVTDATARDAGPSPDAGSSTDPEEVDPRTLCPNYDAGTNSDAGDDATDDGSASRG